MGRRDRGGGADPGIEPVYEGPVVLSSLLARAGSPFHADDVASRFRHAIANGAGRDVAIPALFPAEPRFGSPEEARRLYANLFGLWHRVRAGRGAEDDAPAPLPAPEAPPPLEPRGSAHGRQLSPALVEAVWRHLDALPPRERRRWRDRFENAQPDLAAWLQALSLPDVGTAAAQDLVFEAWAMLDHAFGDRLSAASFRELLALASEPPPLEAEQPALARYVEEVLELVAEEEPGFSPAARAEVERAVATAVAALGRALGN
jgi:hypothetical protein